MSITRFKYDPNDRQAWLKLRSRIGGQYSLDDCRVGASEVAVVIGAYRKDAKRGYDKYKPAIKKFYEDVGFRPKMEIRTMDTYRGNVSEEHIYKNYWRYWDPNDPTEERFLDNAHNNRVIRKARRRHSIVINDKFPHIAATIDYDMVGIKGVLELKAPNKRSWEIFEANIPPAYIFQPQVYMMIYGYDYSEVVALMDGSYLEVFPFGGSKKIQEMIQEDTYLWAKNVCAAKNAIFGVTDEFEKEQILLEFEPYQDGTPAYLEYLKEWHNPDNIKNIIGNDESLGWAVDYLNVGLEISALQGKQNELKAKIQTLMEKNHATVLEFKGFGNITWRNRFSVNRNILKRYNEAVEV